MAIVYKTRDENPQHDINREAAKLLVLSSDKIDKNEYLKWRNITFWTK